MKPLLFFFLSILSFEIVKGQCTPASADNCEDANVLCSLDEVNGYTCSNIDYSNPTGCSPLCPSGGVLNNTSWWAFVTEGGNVCITITFSNCTLNGNGVQYGIWGDCDCSQSIFCDPACTGPGTKTACGLLEPCKTYYLFVDGCTGDVCDFALNTTGGSDPILPNLGDLTGPRIICKDACNVKYKIGLQGASNCKPAWQWTIDGVELDQYNNEVILDFPDEGDFVLCATAVLGNIQSGSICNQKGPKCLTIKVRDSVILKDSSSRNICFEKNPFKWGTHTIEKPGTYTDRFKGACCTIDSTIHFNFLDKHTPHTVYFLGCPGEVYIDPATKKTFSTCQNGTEILLPGISTGKCDSSYNLVAAFINGSGRMREYCKWGEILLEVTPIDRTCADGGYITESFNYKWYLKNDPSKKSLGTDEFLPLTKKDDYCVEITFNGTLDKLKKSCKFDVCEQFNEDDFKYKDICPKGDLALCVGKIGKYSVDTIFPADARHIWTVAGGQILTTNPIAAKEIEVLWNFDPSPAKQYTGIVCYHMESSCPPTEDCCINVTIKASLHISAGKDASTIGLRYKLKPENILLGEWLKVSGPGVAKFTNKNDPNTLVRVTKYGNYIFKWSEIACNEKISDEIKVNFLKLKFINGKYQLDTCCTDSLGSKLITRAFKRNYKFYPNPVSQRRIVIEGGEEDSKDNLVIYDLYGKQVFVNPLVWDANSIEIELPESIIRGVYILKIESEDGTRLIEKMVVE
ncbi:MAG: T9SS type A sorting domain-containing protein [Saprospiraceae bacterium]|nr:T9SS type A sorting domain-containing protein [Saprospiraceae bacterium]